MCISFSKLAGHKRALLCEFASLSVYLSLFLSSTSFADPPVPNGAIWDPEEGQEMMVGEDFWPFGEYDSTLEENGTVTIVVKYAFMQFGQNTQTPGPMAVEWESGSWWGDTENNIVVPGGNFVGGSWTVILWVNGTQVDSQNGPIIASEE